MKKNNSKLPLIGFILSINDYGETYPLVTIAKKYVELGGKSILFCYGTKYKDFAKKSGCEVIFLNYNICEKLQKKIKTMNKKHLETNWALENFFLQMIDKDNFQSDLCNIDEQVKLFKEKKVKLVVAGTGFNFYLSNLSARLAKVPLVRIVSGATLKQYYKQKLATFPDNYEKHFFRLIPSFIKNRLTNWYLLNCKSLVNEFNQLAKFYNLPKISRFLDLYTGDYVIVAEDIAFLNLKATSEVSKENFVGPFLAEDFYKKKKENLDNDVKRHLQRPGSSILLTMGSSIVSKKTFLKILSALNKTDYNVIATYTAILNDDELPVLNDNILLKKFIDDIATINQKVDLAIIHGGRGTVYTAAYSGKPAIGISFHIEQQCNINNLVRHGSTIKISKNSSEKKFLLTLEKIFTDYDVFLKNAQSLKNILHEPKGAENTVKRLLEIIEEEKKNKSQS